MGLDVDAGSGVIQLSVKPSSTQEYWYLMIADPLSAPAVKLIVAEVSPDAMDVIVGAAGAAAGVTDVLDDAAPSSIALTAFSFT